MRLRIASFNLESLDDGPRAAAPLDARIAILRPQLERADADVLCLQEINGQRDEAGAPRRLRALDALLADTPYAEMGRVATHNADAPGVLQAHNLVILSRHPIREQTQVWNDLVPAPVHRFLAADPPDDAPVPVPWDRPLLHARIEVGGRSLHVLNLHLRAPLASVVPGQKAGSFAWKTTGGWAEGFYLSALKRAGQALEARLLVDRIFDTEPDALVAVTGDCNAELRETAVRLLRADDEDTGNGALAGRALIPVEGSLAEERRFTVIHAGRRVMLDHLLASRALMAQFRAAEIHNEMLGDELIAYASVEASPESYHAPLVAEFAFKD
ncbi:MAG: endonuclease/exonuclease/phosphatase family protein [Bauldia litoralis]